VKWLKLNELITIDVKNMVACKFLKLKTERSRERDSRLKKAVAELTLDKLILKQVEEGKF